MSSLTGRRLGAELCEAIGISPDTVYRIIIDCQVHDVASVCIYSRIPEGAEVVNCLKKYKLEITEE